MFSNMTLSGFRGEEEELECPFCSEVVTVTVAISRAGPDGFGGTEQQAAATCPECQEVVWTEMDGYISPEDVGQ